MAAQSRRDLAMRSRVLRHGVRVALTLLLAVACGGGTPGTATPEGRAAKGIEDGAVSDPAGGIDLGPDLEARRRPPPKDVGSRAEALSAVASSNPEGAAKFLREHVQKKPQDVEARLELCRALLVVGRYDEAQAALEGHRGASATDTRLALALARIHWLRGRPQEAEKVLEAVLRSDPNALAARGQLLTLLVDTGRGDEPRARDLMESLYDAWDAGKVKTAEELVAVAQATVARGSTGAFEDANMVLGEAERAAPVADGSWIADRIILMRGAMFLEKYEGEEAAQTLGFLLKRDPWNPDALVGMARVYVDALQFAAASRKAQEALQVNPKHPGAHAALARIALIEGRREEARRRIEQHTLVVNPSHTEGLAVLAALAQLENDPQEFARARDIALALSPKGSRFFTDLADMLALLHLYPQIDEVLSQAVKLAPRDPYINSALGLNLLRLGREEEGRKALERAWKRDKFNDRTHNVLTLYDERIDKHYTEMKGADLFVRLPREDHEIVGPGLIDAVVRARKALDARYGTKAGELRLEFFADPTDFSVRTMGVTSLGASAVCFGHLVTLVGPYRGSHNIDQVIWHELAHVYAIEKSGGRVPRWFTEGLSEWETEVANPAWAREGAELLARARQDGKLRPLGSLELAFIRAESPIMMEVAYVTAAYAIRYLGQTYGLAKLIAILEGYRSGATTETLFPRHLGKDLAVVEREFERWLDARIDDRVRGWQPQQAGEEGEPQSPRDELFLRAAEQVEHGKLDAARQTLEQLIRDGGDGYYTRMLMARVLLKGKKPRAARSHLEQARTFHKEALEPLALLIELAAGQDQVDAEKKYLDDVLAIDAQSFSPAARLLMLSVVTDDEERQALALRRARAIAPLHPIVLSARALALARGGKRGEAKALLERATSGLKPGKGPGDTFVVAAMASHAVGDEATAKVLAARARQDHDLPQVANEALDRLAGREK